jgi:hypothetical protein
MSKSKKPVKPRPLFKLGDKVQTAVIEGEDHIVRTIICVYESPTTEGGWCYTADGGAECPSCGIKGSSTPGLCGGHFRKYKPVTRKVRVRSGWLHAGRVGTKLIEIVVDQQAWTGVLWNGSEDPDWFKSAGLENLA